MTRIVAGIAGSIVLDVPDAGTRPTSDRVRESMFGSLESADLLTSARVLDLYAGSGALALEAISRGAFCADLVERAPRAARIATENARRVERAVAAAGVERPRIHVHRTAADTFLAGVRVPYDIVFVDPPYDVPEHELAATLALLAPHLTHDATVIVERSARSAEPAWPDRLVADRSRRYGDTTLWWAYAE